MSIDKKRTVRIVDKPKYQFIMNLIRKQIEAAQALGKQQGYYQMRQVIEVPGKELILAYHVLIFSCNPDDERKLWVHYTMKPDVSPSQEWIAKKFDVIRTLTKIGLASDQAIEPFQEMEGKIDKDNIRMEAGELLKSEKKGLNIQVYGTIKPTLKLTMEARSFDDLGELETFSIFSQAEFEFHSIP